MITLFAMTLRGHHLISSVIERYGSGFIDQVISAKDANIKDDYYEEITGLCMENNIPVSNRSENIAINSPYVLAIGWRWLIDLDPKSKLIVFHDSILPSYRGFAPLVNALINKEPEIGVTALFASEKYDRGDIITQCKTSITYPLTIEQAIDINNANYQKCCFIVCDMIAEGKQIDSKPQDEKMATYSLWRDDDDYQIDWARSAEDIERFIDAVGHPYLGASSFAGNKKVRILKAAQVKDKTIVIRQVGKIIEVEDGMPVVVCGTGLLQIREAINDETGNSFLPLKNFRIKFI